jgi:hypothetical protein
VSFVNPPPAANGPAKSGRNSDPNR